MPVPSRLTVHPYVTPISPTPVRPHLSPTCRIAAHTRQLGPSGLTQEPSCADSSTSTGLWGFGSPSGVGCGHVGRKDGGRRSRRTSTSEAIGKMLSLRVMTSGPLQLSRPHMTSLGSEILASNRQCGSQLSDLPAPIRSQLGGSEFII